MSVKYQMIFVGGLSSMTALLYFRSPVGNGQEEKVIHSCASELSGEAK